MEVLKRDSRCCGRHCRFMNDETEYVRGECVCDRERGREKEREREREGG